MTLVLCLLLAAPVAALQLHPGHAATRAGPVTQRARFLMLAKKGKKPKNQPSQARPPLAPLPPPTPLQPLPPMAGAPSSPAATGRPLSAVPLVLADGVDFSEAVVRPPMPSSGAAARPAAGTDFGVLDDAAEALVVDPSLRVEDEPFLQLPSFADFARRGSFRRGVYRLIALRHRRTRIDYLFRGTPAGSQLDGVRARHA